MSVMWPRKISSGLLSSSLREVRGHTSHSPLGAVVAAPTRFMAQTSESLTLELGHPPSLFPTLSSDSVSSHYLGCLSSSSLGN